MQTDVLVLGAGPAGSTTAYFLAQNGVNVLLADREDFPRDKACGDGVTLAGVSVLARMGLWPHQVAGYQPFVGARIFSPTGACLQLVCQAGPAGAGPGHGYIIPRQAFDEMLREHAVTAGAQFLPGFRATEPIYDAGHLRGWRGQQRARTLDIRARLVVIATGAHAGPVRALGLRQPGGHSAVAMRAYFQGIAPLEPVIEFHCVPDLLPGYGWLFPMADQRTNVGVFIDAESRCLTRQGGTIRAALDQFIASNPRLRDTLHGATLLGSPNGFPLRMDYPARQTYAENVLVVGEAAGLVDPLTGEGIALALQSAELAAQVATEAVTAGDCSAARLAVYEQALKDRYLAYFTSASQLRTQLKDPDIVEALLASAIQMQALRASGSDPAHGLALLWLCAKWLSADTHAR
jgi:geranylgeranyl reductase family protein